MPIQQTITTARVPIHIWAGTVESDALEQLENTAGLPFVFHHVAAMPDVHLGIGATVGSVVATTGAICPAAVGVDIGCGMVAQKTTVKAESLSSSQLRVIRSEIERSIPVGFHEHKRAVDAAREFMHASKGPHVASSELLKKASLQLGTLGGGNHFIEVCVDRADGYVWLMLHSGSRNIGKTVAEIHINRARSSIAKLAINLRDRDLAWFTERTPEFEDYIHDLEWCQAYARRNRDIMMDTVVAQFARALGRDDRDRIVQGPRVNCHHNYVAREKHYGENVLVTRKGAIRARQGDLGIIPGSMGAGSFIVRGLGNAEAFDSAPHGAGRRMSRNEARRRFTAADLARQTEGVECRKDRGVVDEIPSAYKDIAEVIRNSSDLVEVVAELKQVVCVKG